MNSRDIALDILNKSESDQAYINIALNNSRQLNKLTDVRDVSLVYKLVYGVLQNRLYLDYVLNHFMKKSVERQRPVLRSILRIGAYQLLFLDRVPAHAACHEAVSQAKRRGMVRASGFVNGVLRNIARNPHVALPDKDKQPVEYLSVRYSHPKWMVKRWLNRFGFAETIRFLETNNREPHLTLRVNTLRTTLDNCKNTLIREGVENVESGLLLPDIAFRLDNATHIDRLDSFKQGLFSVQDEASMYVATQLNPRPGQRILDMCAAPGGKTTHMAAIMGNKGHIVAVDTHEHRLQLIEDNAQRLGVKIVSMVHADATTLVVDDLGRFDAVLCDAPCSGLGTLRSKPEIKWYRKESDVRSLAVLQKQLIEKAADLLLSGGRMVYSTCTNEPEETDAVIEHILRNKNDIVLLGEPLHLLPYVYDTDGFFIACLEKKS